MSRTVDAGVADSQATEADEVGRLVSGARVVTVWTTASRITGFLRVAAIAAIIGPTFFGNLLQTALYVPLLLSEVLAATLIPSVLAPRIVHRLQAGDEVGASRIARGFLGAVLPLFAAVVLAAMLAAPLLLRVMTVAVDDPTLRAQQIALGWPLLALLLPQMILHAFIATSIAVQHAHHRFAVASAAQMVENLGLVGVLVLSAIAFGFGGEIETITTGHVIALGAGSTLVVALHAAVQWWGAARLGTRLYPTRGWRDREVRATLRTALPASGASTLNGIGWLSVLVASGHVPGGAVAFQVAQSLFNLPISLFSRPFAVSQLPLLARRNGERSAAAFRSILERSLRLALFVAVPAGLAFVAIPGVLAGAVAYGEMASPEAIDLVATAVLGLGFGLAGEAVLTVYASAAYARLDTASQLRAAVIRTVLIAVGLAVAHGVAPEASILVIALGCSAATIAAAAYLRGRVNRDLSVGALGDWRRWIAGTVALAILSVLPAALIAGDVAPADAGLERVATAAMLIVLTVLVYLALQRLLRSAELKALLQRVPRRAAVASEGGNRT